MVGRLVEDEQLRLGDQRAGEHEPPALPARQRGDRGLEALGQRRQLRAAEQPGEDVPDRRLTLERVGIAIPQQLLGGRATAVQLVALGDQDAVQGGRAGDRSLVGRMRAGDQPGQGRLARPVVTDDADPLAGVESERDVMQDGVAAVALGDRLEVDEVAWGDPRGDSGSRAARVRGRVSACSVREPNQEAPP
jgi:hypothetical protein